METSRWRAGLIPLNKSLNYECTQDADFSPAGIGGRESGSVAPAVCSGQIAGGQGPGIYDEFVVPGEGTPAAPDRLLRPGVAVLADG